MHDWVHRLSAALLGAALLAQVSCGSSGDANRPAFKITSVGWWEENIDPSFWTPPLPNGQTAFYDFFVHYEGDVTFADFKSVRMIEPNGNYFWDLLPDETFLDTTNKVIGGWRRWQSTWTHLLPIGDFRVEVELADGRIVTAQKTIPAPGRVDRGGFAFMHTEDLVAVPGNSAPMVRRANVTAGTIDAVAESLTFTFSVADDLVHSGCVWAFDASGKPLGNSPLFRDPTSGAVSSALGGVLNTDGTPNTVTLNAANLQLAAGATFSQIATARVLLVDGQQYANGAYDCISVSGSAVLTAK